MCHSGDTAYVALMTIPPRLLWAYTYALLPPQPADRLKSLRALLAREHAAATRRSGVWEGRLVADERISHILVLSDTPELTMEANERVEGELKSLDAGFELTVPMAVLPDAPGAVAPKD